MPAGCATTVTAPIISSLVRSGRMQAVAYPQSRVRGRGHVRAHRGHGPGSRDGPRHPSAIDEALAAKEAGKEKVILFNYSGHGLLDLSAYDGYLHGMTTD